MISFFFPLITSSEFHPSDILSLVSHLVLSPHSVSRVQNETMEQKNMHMWTHCYVVSTQLKSSDSCIWRAVIVAHHSLHQGGYAFTSVRQCVGRATQKPTEMICTKLGRRMGLCPEQTLLTSGADTDKESDPGIFLCLFFWTLPSISKGKTSGVFSSYEWVLKGLLGLGGGMRSTEGRLVEYFIMFIYALQYFIQCYCFIRICILVLQSLY